MTSTHSMPDPMISFHVGNFAFVCRAAAVCVHEERVLLHEAVEGGFWVLPGGRVNIMEPAASAVLRELREEIGEEAEVEGLLWIVEDFFDYDSRSWHEIAFYFKVKVPDEMTARGAFWGAEGDLRLRYRWVPIDELTRMTVYPPFLREALRTLPPSPQHVVQARRR